MIEKRITPIDEQETSINIDYIDRCAYVYSTNKTMINKLYKLIENNKDNSEIIKDDKYGLEIKVPIKWIKISPPRKVSEETRIKAAERMRKMQEERKHD